MGSDSGDVWVLVDQAGSYYLLDGATIEAARVPAADVGKLHALLASMDTVGFSGPRGSDEGQGIPRLVLLQPLHATQLHGVGLPPFDQRG